MKKVVVLRTLAAAAILTRLCANAAEFQNERGWIWHIPPQSSDWTSLATDGLVMRQDELKTEKLLFGIAHSLQSSREVLRFRPVGFTHDYKRIEFNPDAGGSTDDAALQSFLLDLSTVPRNQLAFVGIEKLTKENLRDRVAPESFQKLKAAGENSLPFPLIGKSYNFELTSIDGKKIRSADLHGKVVLLDFWANWCAPCMAKMPSLKKAYDKWHDQGFEIIGLNHDQATETAKRVILEQKLPWPNASAPSGSRRQLWFSATGTQALPRLLLIDRDGIFLSDVSPRDLDAQIEGLMARH